ncbi:MAG: polysaccharide pyruvyl transferase CsaB [Candidatus Bipolaricaulia bacterium]
MDEELSQGQGEGQDQEQERNAAQGKFLIVGYYGFGNFGDEAILASLVSGLCLRFPDVELVILSKDPQETSERHGVRAINRWNLFSIVRELRKTTLFISGGGGLLQDSTSRRSLWYYLSLILLARLSRKPIFLIGQGIGPIRSELNRRLTAIVLRWVDFISVRDETSLWLLRDWGVDEDRLLLGEDLALCLENRDDAKGLSLGSADDNRNLLGVALKEGARNQERFTRSMAEALDEASRRWGLQVVFFSTFPDQDLKIAEEIRDRMQERAFIVNSAHLSVREMINLIDEARIVIGTRLHVLEFAALSGIPFIALSYDPKVDAFVERLEQASDLQISLWSVDRIESGQIIQELGRLIEHEQNYRERLKHGAEYLGRSVHKSFETLCERIWERIQVD